MNVTEYENFTHLLLQNVQADWRVIGLVALGDMTGQKQAPDNWSPHQFLLVVKSGAQADFQHDFLWLPHPDRIIMSLHDDAHRVRIMYDIPHLVEFAVLDANELHGMRIGAYRILFSRGDIEGILTQISHQPPPIAYEPHHDLCMVLMLLYIGANHQARGDVLTAHIIIKCQVLHHVLPLLMNGAPLSTNLCENAQQLEFQQPSLAKQLTHALELPLMACAQAIYTLIAQHDVGIPFPHEMGAIVSQHLDDCANVRG